MKNKIIIIAIVILSPVLIFVLGGFHFSDDYIIGRNVHFEKIYKIDAWKNAGGENVIGRDVGGGDTLLLQKKQQAGKLSIKNDTLFFGDKPIAKVVSFVHRCFTFDYKLTVQSFDGEKTGYYVSK